MTLLICPVRPGDKNEELRYALRSWEQNLVMPDLRLLTVGYKPIWLDPDYHVEGNRYTSAPLAVWDNIILASHYANRLNTVGHRVVDEAIYMNDDFFCLDPVTGVVPVKRNKTLAQHRAMYSAQAGGWFLDSLDLTASWLASEGYPHPDSYDVHRPLLARPGAMLRALSRWDRGTDHGVPQWRTAYGVLNQIEAHPVGDVKLGKGITGFGTPWVSTSDATWRLYAVEMARRFPETSRWEI